MVVTADFRAFPDRSSGRGCSSQRHVMVAISQDVTVAHCVDPRIGQRLVAI